MADVIGLSDVSSPDTGKGKKLKTGGKRSYNMPDKEKCKSWKKLGYKSFKDCREYGTKKWTGKNVTIPKDKTSGSKIIERLKSQGKI